MSARGARTLLPKQRATVPEVLARHVLGRDLRAFESRGHERAWRYSDVDLVVTDTVPLPDPLRAPLVADFEGSGLLFRIELVEYSGTCRRRARRSPAAAPAKS